jgi:hypothetical protein
MDIQLKKLKENLESATEDMSSKQLSWHPPGKWCAAEVLEHLYLTYTATIRKCGTAPSAVLGFSASVECED